LKKHYNEPKKKQLTQEELDGLKKYSNQQVENDFIGVVFKSHSVYSDVLKRITPHHDFNSEVCQRLFDFLKDCKTHYSSNITQQTFGAYMAQSEDKKEFYESMRGWATIERLMNNVDEQSYKKYFNQLKKFSLMRKFYLQGFPVEKITKLKDYEHMTPEQLVKVMQHNLVHISTQIQLGSDAVLLGSDARSKILNLRENPDIGFNIANFDIMTMMLRGFRRGKLSLFGALSNLGKSRFMLNLAVFQAIYNKTPVLVIMNETDELDAFLCQMTTILNNPLYGFNLNIRENVMANNLYEGEEQFQSVMEVAQFLEREANIYFIETTQYSDSDLRREIDKYVVGKGVELVFYDTLKNNDSDYALLKKTAQFLRDTAVELNISVVASFQASDDTNLIAPHDITSMNIASAKQIMHFADSMFMFNLVKKENHRKYNVLHAFEKPMIGEGQTTTLNDQKTYYYFKHLKNRAGAKRDLMFEVDLDYNRWVEEGYAILS
jgi:replicative DNA helicase